jgi:hypothetical protein
MLMTELADELAGVIPTADSGGQRSPAEHQRLHEQTIRASSVRLAGHWPRGQVPTATVMEEQCPRLADHRTMPNALAFPLRANQRHPLSGQEQLAAGSAVVVMQREVLWLAGRSPEREAWLSVMQASLAIPHRRQIRPADSAASPL